MSKYIHYFTAVTDFNTARSENYEEPWVSLTEESEIFDVDYNKTEEERLREMPLTFEITSSGNVNWIFYKEDDESETQTRTIEYKKNDGDWTSITSTTDGAKIDVISGDIVQFRGDNDSYCIIGEYCNCFGGTDCGFKVKGNIMSLIDPTNYATMTSFHENSEGNFYNLFQGCTGLTDVSELILPATTLTEGCYESMFSRCTGLVNAPVLPATTLAVDCYEYMFDDCTSLVNAPELPATTLTNYCYYGMFNGCTSLATAPELPTTTLVDYCYQAMFYGCTSLATAPELPATTLAQSCYYGMFQDCTSLVNAPSILPATTLARQCYYDMFNGCTSLTTAPVLPATTLVTRCYYYMFNGCTNLNYIKCLATNISASSCTSNWVSGVASTGMFIKDKSMNNWTRGVNGIPTDWGVVEYIGSPNEQEPLPIS